MTTDLVDVQIVFAPRALAFKLVTLQGFSSDGERMRAIWVRRVRRVSYGMVRDEAYPNTISESLHQVG